MFKYIRNLIDIRKNDPVKGCKLYKAEGCSHVDGLLCNFPKCSMQSEYELFILEQELDIPFKLRYYNNGKQR